MEAAAISRAAELSSDKATRIVEAMRVTVAARGISGATFDLVAREAGVSRGLLHYYFATKERLLVEAVRRESDLRIARLEHAVEGAHSADDVLAALVASLEEYLGEVPTAPVMLFEMMALGHRNPEIAASLSELFRRTRNHLAEVLQAQSDAGVLHLRADAETVAAFMLMLADGITVRRMGEPELDIGPLMEQATIAARAILS